MAIKSKNEGKYTFVLSSEKKNRYGFSIVTGGIALEAFKANPVMLFQHDQNIVLGRWDNIRVEGTELLADAVFDEKDEFALSIKRKIDDGFIKACSICVEVLSMENKEGGDGPVATETEAWEGSIVSVPGNTDALKLFYQGKELDPENSKVLLSAFNKPQNTDTMAELTAAQKQQRASLGLPETATDEQVATKIQELTTASLTARKNAADAMVTAGITAGKVAEGEKEFMVNLAAASNDGYENVKKMIDARQGTAGGQQQQTATARMTAGAHTQHEKPEGEKVVRLGTMSDAERQNLYNTDRAAFDEAVRQENIYLATNRNKTVEV